MKSLAIIATLVLAGCSAAPSAPTVMSKLNQRYAGKAVDEFFQNFGQPADKGNADGNGKVYRWVAIQPRQDIQGAPSAHVTSNNQLHFPSYTARDTRELVCQLAVHTNKKNRITSLAITLDTEGKRSNSRCAEIFDQD